MARLIFVTGTPATVAGGSGTWVGISVLRDAIVSLGHDVTILTPSRAGGETALSRILFNIRIRKALRSLPADACLVEGNATAFGLLLMILLTSLAFNTMMFLLMVRVEDPLVPRAIFGILNTLLFFPSGSIYPIQAFPFWLRAIAKVDPFTYAVHGFKALLLKETGLVAVVPDMIYLSIFAVVTLTVATPLFKRTL